MAFSPDGEKVTSTDRAGTRKLWNVKSVQENTISSEFNQQKKQQKTSMFIDKDGWILRKGVRILWLPKILRGNVVSEHKCIIAIGNSQGRVVIIDFSQYEENIFGLEDFL
ncbi:hypothetical protein HK096_011205, partial [Nowakowskiella sp. JEL0078]